jgi:hypothetical protein
MTLNLKIHPQTALLLTVDSLMSLDGAYKVELFIEAQSVAGAIFRLNDDLTTGAYLVAANDLPELLQQLMQYLQAGEAVVGEPVKGSQAEHSADSTGVPE